MSIYSSPNTKHLKPLSLCRHINRVSVIVNEQALIQFFLYFSFRQVQPLCSTIAGHRLSSPGTPLLRKKRCLPSSKCSIFPSLSSPFLERRRGEKGSRSEGYTPLFRPSAFPLPHRCNNRCSTHAEGGKHHRPFSVAVSGRRTKGYLPGKAAPDGICR